MENKKVNDLILSCFNEKIDLSVMDLSFCSSLPLLKYVYNILKIKEIIVLIKPQFEFARLSTKIKLSNNFKIIPHRIPRQKLIHFILNLIFRGPGTRLDLNGCQ